MKVKLAKEKKFVKQEERSITVDELEIGRIVYIPDMGKLRVFFKQGLTFERDIKEDEKLAQDMLAEAEKIVK